MTATNPRCTRSGRTTAPRIVIENDGVAVVEIVGITALLASTIAPAVAAP